MRRENLRAAGLVALACALVAVPTAAPAPAATALPSASACPMFPSDNVWNADISTLPVHPSSAQWLASMSAASTKLHPDFGPSFGAQPVPYGIPYTVVDASHPKVAVSFQYASESDPGPYPFGADTPIEGGPSATGDRHALMVESSSCTLYELFDAHYSPAGSTAGSGAIWDLRSNALRPSGWTSADAAGLPILPGLLRLDEVQAGSVTHAIRFTAARTDRSFLWPARHQAGAAADPSLPPMGARFRLKSSFDISSFLPQTQTILRAMQLYGLILADNGSNWYFTGTADPGWDNSVLDQLKTVPASAFEAVDESSLMVGPNSGQVRGTATPPPSGPGYRLVASDGGIFSFGGAPFLGSTGSIRLNRPVVGMASVPGGGGYWLVASDGGIFAFGTAGFYGSTGSIRLNSPIVGMATTATGHGYWLVAADGGIFSFGDARFVGSAGSLHLVKPIIGMAPTPSGQGYWLAAADGGLFTYGDAAYFGSGVEAGGGAAGIAAAPEAGYWLVTAAGAVEAFGPAVGYGSVTGRLNSPVISMAPTPSGAGYWLLAADGGIFSFGDAQFYGSTASIRLNRPIVGMSASP